MPITFYLINLGCKVNAYETESVGRMLEEEGFVRAASDEDADVTVIFTCAVTNTAAAKSRKQIHRSRRLKPHGVIAVAGCYAQIEPDALKEADILIGSAHKQALAGYIKQYLQDGIPVRDVTDLSDLPFESLSADHFSDRTRAFLKIQDGCNQFCTYCVIPYARGRERSMPPDEVIEEVRRISRSHREIVLAGIHTGRYGTEYGVTLTDLLNRILKEVPELPRIRISSIEVSELSDEFIGLIRDDPRIARHLHIPVQAGSDLVLRRMGRPYDTAEYYAKISEIRSLIPGISISTDLMVGFPGETDEAFEETLQFLDRCAFSFLHVFPFSLRKHTAAEQMDGHLPPEVKKRRAAVCLEKSRQLQEAYILSKKNQEVIVLTETENRGYSSEYIEVNLSEPYERGRFVRAVITGSDHGKATAEGRGYLETE